MIVYAPDFSIYLKKSWIEKYSTILYNLNFQEHSSIIPDLSNVLMVQLNLLGFSPDLRFIYFKKSNTGDFVIYYTI